MTGRTFTDFDPLDIEIADGVRVRDLDSRAECQSALLRLEMDMERVNAQIQQAEVDPSRRPPGWRTKAQSAMRWKKRARKAVLQMINAFPATTSARKTSAQKALLDTIRDVLGDAHFERLVQTAKDRHPEAFGGAEHEPIGWTLWMGGDCPVSPEALVYYRFRYTPDVDCGPATASGLDWCRHSGDHTELDIVAYRMDVPAMKMRTEVSQ